MPAHPPAVSKGDHIRGHPSILTPTGVTRHTRTLNGPSAGLLLAGISAQLERSPEAKPQASHPRKWLGLKRGPSQVSCRRQRLPDCHGAGTSVRRCMPHGSVILTAKLIAGHDAEGERRESRPRRSGCRRCPRSGSRVGDGHQPRIIQQAGTRKAAMPRNAAAEPAATAQATRAQEDAAARSVHLPIPASR